MPKKPASGKPTGRLSAAQRELLRKEEELRRKEAELQKRLKKLPEEIQQKRDKQRQAQRMLVTTVALAEYRNRIHRQPGRTPLGHAPARTLRSHRSQGKVKFLVLCMIFVLILLLLWRVMPT